MKLTIPSPIKQNIQEIKNISILFVNDKKIKSIDVDINFCLLNECINFDDDLFNNAQMIEWKVQRINNLTQLFSHKDKNSLIYKQKISISDEIKTSQVEKIIQPIFEEITMQEIEAEWIPYEKSKIIDYSNYPIYGQELLQQKITIPETGILILKDGIISNTFGFPTITIKDKIKCLIEMTFFGDKNIRDLNDPLKSGYENIARRFKKNKLIKLKGKCLNLHSTFGDINIFHYIVDSINKLDIVKSVCPINIQDFDWIVLPKSNLKLAIKINENLNLPKEKVILFDSKTESLQFDELYQPTINGYSLHCSDSSFKEIRKIMNVKVDKIKHKKLYFARDGYGRDIYNKDEVENLLFKYGYTKIDCSEQDDIINLMEEAKVIIGPHGAAFTNCIFCSEGTCVIELFSDSHVREHYRSICKALNLNHISIICDVVSKDGVRDKVDTFCPNPRDLFAVNIEQLEQILKKYE